MVYIHIMASVQDLLSVLLAWDPAYAAILCLAQSVLANDTS